MPRALVGLWFSPVGDAPQGGSLWSCLYYAAVLIMWFAAVARWRWPIMLGVLVFAGAFGAVGQAIDDPMWWAFSLGMFGLIFSLILLGLLVGLSYHPAVLVTRPEVPAFDAPVNPGPVFSAAAFSILGGATLGEDIGDIAAGEEMWAWNVVPGVLWLFVVALHWYVALGSWGVRIRADGVLHRHAFGSLFIPWEAFATDFPVLLSTRQRLNLCYGTPELVRTHGLHLFKGTLPVVGIDGAHLARVIQEYVGRPDHRTAIGSQAEYRRITAILGG